jgi:hypothetical protein
LLLAVGLLALPITGAARAAAVPAVHAAHHGTTQATVHESSVGVGNSPLSGLHRTRHVHRTAPMVAAVTTAGVLFVVFLVCSGVVRRRISQLAGVRRHWWSSRAPPTGTGSHVPFGYPSDAVGRLWRSPRAVFSGPIPVHC